MANRGLFNQAAAARARVPEADTVNEAGGKAYKTSPQAALAQYAATGTLANTYYMGAGAHLDKLLGLAAQCDDEFVAKAAVWGRQEAYLKDVPALLLAYLAARGTAPELVEKAFPRVVNNPKMVRNVIQILRSGRLNKADGNPRVSIPRRVRALLRSWLESRHPVALLNASVGNDPKLDDLINMIRPKPGDDARRAMYAWLRGDINPNTPVGKEDKAGGKAAPRYEALPEAFRHYDAHKVEDGLRDPELMQKLDFRLLDSLPLDAGDWTAIALGAKWQMLRMNLNTFARHNVLKDKKVVEMLAAKLRDEDEIKKAMVYPYQLYAAFKATEHNDDVPMELKLALQDAMDLSVNNVPVVEGECHVFVDVSYSMHSPVTGIQESVDPWTGQVKRRKPSTVMCHEVGAVIASAFLRKNPQARIYGFNTQLFDASRCGLNPRDSVMTNVEKLASLPSGGTDCGVGLSHLVKTKATGDFVLFVSDYESWFDPHTRISAGIGRRGTAMAELWTQYRSRNKNAKLCCMDLTPRPNHQVTPRADILNVGGFADTAFDVMASFAKGELDGKHWSAQIDKVEL